MQLLLKTLDQLWNIRFVTGHRTTIAQVFLGLTTLALTYQGLALDAELITAGINLPDIPSRVFVLLGPVAAYFAAKVRQFAQEHPA